MTAKLSKIVHIVAVCIFVGSIPAHIVLGGLAGGSQNAAAFAALHQAKYALTLALTGTGIALTLLSGLLLALSRKDVFRTRWMRTKLVVVLAIVGNGAAVLTPLAERMRDMAVAAMDTGALSPEFHVAETQETVAGAINLVLILIVIILVAVKPKLRSSAQEA